ncbi:mRNA-capping enzyme [Chloropicon primus]|uniref:mRNA guanylyltransferase n=1 Tax=Chloropicon primus TaxID=1764295 RepID=A0A5B8MX09_9CHLO|nr:mRNA-capping enzyme [Chloropicon primus]|eukprot:QDZ24112.1 mRNA-capping enzyme [Chloropicon primus]
MVNENGVEAYKRAVEERKALFQEAKRARLMSDATETTLEGRGDEGNTASTSRASGVSSSTQPMDPNKDIKEEDLSFVPKGWFDCPPCGEPIGLFIPSKVPLSAAYNSRLPADKWYTPRSIIESQKALGRDIGLVVNLTRSKVYYNARQFEELGVEVVTIECAGRGEAPTPEQVNAFWYTANSYCTATQNAKHVLVHCTHGFNRTGFMICHMLLRSPLSFQRYLSVKEVIGEFAKSRPPGIYKPLYLDTLFKYYHENKNGFVMPKLPTWKSEKDIEDDDDDVGAPLESTGEAGKEKAKDGEPMQHDDLLGEEIIGQHKEEVKNLVRMYILNQEELGRIHHFPGSQPVSFSRDNMQMLEERRYYVTWKADGTRYLLLLMQDGVYIISRSFDVRRLQLRFPLWGLSKDKKPSFKFTPQNGTLLDGEMVVDEDAYSGEKRRRFYAYDLISMDGKKITDLPFKQRYAYIEDYVVVPRKLEQHAIGKEKERYPYHMYNYDDECFAIRRKSFYPLHSCKGVLSNLIPKLLHESDGLIFQDWEDRYVPLTCHALLKWKYSHLNSVDFKLDVKPEPSRKGEGGGGEGEDGENDYILVLSRGGRPQVLEGAKVRFPNHINPLDYLGRIVECSYNQERDTWVFIRERVDKETPNDYNVYMKVLKSIKDNIGEEEVVEWTSKAAQENPLYERDRNRKSAV